MNEQDELRSELKDLRPRLAKSREDVKCMETREKEIIKEIILRKGQCQGCMGKKVVDKKTLQGSVYEAPCDICNGTGIWEEKL